MTLNDWVKWSFRQHRSWHPYRCKTWPQLSDHSVRPQAVKPYIMAPVVGLSIFLGGVFVFKLTDPEWQERLASFRQGNPSDLTDEISLLRVLIEEAANSKHVGLCGQLIALSAG